jgi:hypothetical protein
MAQSNQLVRTGKAGEACSHDHHAHAKHRSRT